MNTGCAVPTAVLTMTEDERQVLRQRRRSTRQGLVVYLAFTAVFMLAIGGLSLLAGADVVPSLLLVPVLTTAFVAVIALLVSVGTFRIREDLAAGRLDCHSGPVEVLEVGEGGGLFCVRLRRFSRTATYGEREPIGVVLKALPRHSTLTVVYAPRSREVLRLCDGTGSLLYDCCPSSRGLG